MTLSPTGSLIGKVLKDMETILEVNWGLSIVIKGQHELWGNKYVLLPPTPPWSHLRSSQGNGYITRGLLPSFAHR